MIDSSPELQFDQRFLAGHLDGAVSAREMLDLLLALPKLEGAPADDLTVMVIRAANGTDTSRCVSIF